jgi:enoyl-CoA hydratase/carnithine racemase
MAADESLLIDVRDGIVTLSLNRPGRRNALDGELVATGGYPAKRAKFEAAGLDPAVVLAR